MFGKRAAELLREVAFCQPDTLPPWNDELIRQVLEEVSEHNNMMKRIFRDVNKREAVKFAARGEGTEDEFPGVDWSQQPDEAAAVIVHHESILRNKRLLMTYVKERADRIKSLRWRGRSIPEHILPQLSPTEVQYFKTYDRLLTKYMRKGSTGIGMDLTLDARPPGDPNLQVRVVKDYGEMMFSSGRFILRRNMVLFLPRHEVESLVREGVLEPIELDNHLVTKY
ncbi:hypothetical protein WJX72_000554 [[Myrmecia] bisecta]|uniref:GINS complex subunit 1 n=1 Tax=[Myrmecia] bisecta TaxID=41462 RepID=A0AAW1PB50_9CHLO